MLACSNICMYCMKFISIFATFSFDQEMLVPCNIQWAKCRLKCVLFPSCFVVVMNQYMAIWDFSTKIKTLELDGRTIRKSTLFLWIKAVVFSRVILQSNCKLYNVIYNSCMYCSVKYNGVSIIFFIVSILFIIMHFFQDCNTLNVY